jgi:hypothetical protein
MVPPPENQIRIGVYRKKADKADHFTGRLWNFRVTAYRLGG